jgi:hypothetical protein
MSLASSPANSMAPGLSPALPQDRDAASDSARALHRWAVCGAIFVILLCWQRLYPYTGDGDSALHYLNARDAAIDPVSGLHAWARPICKLIMAPFALYGIYAVRAVMAAVAALTCWQTIRLAEELDLRNSLLAGPMVLWQPLAFAVAGDTMTEIPMALGIVTAIRLWRNGWWRTSALLVGFLPAVRPEGFFLGLLWGAMTLFSPALAGKRSGFRRLTTLAALPIGLLTWGFACWALTWNHDALYVLTIWNWPLASFAGYGRGSILHHVIRWPLYCGIPLTALFLLGLRPSHRREMAIPWAVWWTVFAIHSVLFWGGWFASCGLMRIMASTAPITALICLHGYNTLERRLLDRQAIRRRAHARTLLDRLLAPRAIAVFTAILCTAWAFAQYAFDPGHYDCFPLARCTAFIQEHHLLAPDTAFFTGNQIATAQLDLAPHPACLMESPCDPELIRRHLAALPIGAIGVWDNRQAPVWHGHRISDLASHGFTILYSADLNVPSFTDLLLRRPGTNLHYVVLRKDAPFLESTPPQY